MMPKLLNQTKNKTVIADVEIANEFMARLVGLIGRRTFENKALWIHACNSVHTCFMKFSIDLVFVDEKLQVKALRKNLRPWRMTLPVFGAKSVFEMPAGTLEKVSVEVGDKLDVVENT